ncbi:polycystin-1-like protein 3 [Rhinophrynus dorsalis]
MPHVVDIRDTLKLFANAMKNPVGLALLGALLGFFIMVIIWAWRKDNEDMKKVRVAILTDNDPAFHFRYVIKVCTGHRIGAGTTSQVVVTLYGAEGQSDPHLLADSEKQLFRSGAVDVFLLKTRYLGELHSLRLWHSNSGNSPSWYVHRVTVTDMSTQRTWYFLCNSWISADLADCQLDRIYSAATKRDIMSLRYLLFSGSVEKFLKDHLWLSIWTRCPWSPFTRVQRICCCMSLLFCSLIINIMFWKQNEDNEAPPGQFPITLTEIKISIQSSIMLLPLNILIVQMFQLIQVPVKQVNLPSNKLRVSLAPRPTSKEATTEHLLEDFIDLVDFLHKYVVQVLGESPEDLMASNTASLLQHIDALSSLVKSYICVHGPNQENPTRVTVLKVHQYHFLHYLKKTLEKLQFQVASVDLTYVPKPINYIQATNVLYDLRDLLQSQSISGETLPNSLTTSFPAFTAQRTLSSRLPKCFQYLCWLLLFAISSFSAFYLALLTLDMTRENATRWLVSILLSLCQSLFVLPPLKVLAQTVFQFRVLRRNNIDDATEEQQLHGILSHFASRPDWQLSGWRNPDNPLYQAPANKSITGLKTQRMMEMRLYKLIQEIIVNVVFLIMIMIMAYSEKSPNEFNLNRAITNSFSSTFNIIGNIQDFYSWSHVTLLPNLYSQYPGFITDGNCFLLGSPRIRQVRRILGSAGDQSRYNSEDTGSYGTGWSPLNSSNTEDDKWKYYTEKELGGYPIWTQLGWYSGGGYVVELGMNRSYASSMLDWLEMSKWLDGYTKAVFLEFNVYNANVNLFCVATFILETNMIGNFMTSTDLQIMRLYQTTGNIFTLQFVSEIICLIIVLYTIVQQGLHLKAEKLSYFRKSKNLLDLSIIMICCCISALYVKKIFLRRRDIDRYHLDHSRFVSLYETATIDCIHGYSVAFLVSLVTVKLWSLLSLNPNLHLITVTLQKAWSEISGFLLTILILLVAYSITCNLLFGWSISNYKSFFESAVTIISLIIGIFDYEEVLTLDPILGSLLITTCVIFLIFVVVNILLSAMLMVFSQERKNPTPYKDREIVELLVLKLSGLLGVRKKPNDSEASAADKDKGT